MKPHIVNLTQDMADSLDIELLKEIESATSKDELIEKLLQQIVSSKKVLIGKSEILKMFDIPKQRFEHLVREKKIPHIYINNKLRLFNPQEIYEYLNKNFKIV